MKGRKWRVKLLAGRARTTSSTTESELCRNGGRSAF